MLPTRELDNAAADDPNVATNVIPLRMSVTALRDGWLDLMVRLYEAESYFERFDSLFIEGKLPLAETGDDALQRQIERLDIANNVGLDRHRHAGRGVSGAFQNRTARFDQDMAAERAKRQGHQHHRCQHLEPVRMRLRPESRDVVLGHPVQFPLKGNMHGRGISNLKVGRIPRLRFRLGMRGVNECTCCPPA